MRIKKEDLNGANGMHGIACTLRFVPTMVTDPLAGKFLENLHPRQRGVRKSRVPTYCADMVAGRWPLTHECVGVDDEGRLFDGQTRMLAVRMAHTIRPGIAVPMVICYGASPDVMPVVNTGATRTVFDAARVADMDIPSAQYCSIARQMASGAVLCRAAISTQEGLDLVATHQRAIDFALACTSPALRGVTVAGVRSVIARAWYSADRARLAEFGKQLRTGLVESKARDSASVSLRDWLLVQELASARGGKSRRELTAGYSECALVCFLAGRPAERFAMPKSDHFPIPAPARYDR